MIAQHTSNTKVTPSEARTVVGEDTSALSVDPYRGLQFEKTMAAHLFQVIAAYSVVMVALFLF